MFAVFHVALSSKPADPLRNDIDAAIRAADKAYPSMFIGCVSRKVRKSTRGDADAREGARLMEAIWFTLVAVILYLGADWILNRIEVAAGKRFEHRTLIFFAILLTMALVSFTLIRSYTGNP